MKPITFSIVFSIVGVVWLVGLQEWKVKSEKIRHTSKIKFLRHMVAGCMFRGDLESAEKYKKRLDAEMKALKESPN